MQKSINPTCLYDLTIKVDTNDMDYRTKTYRVCGEDAATLAGLFLALQKSSFNNSRLWDVEEYDYTIMRKKYSMFSDEQFDLLIKYIPTCDQGYTRAIESVSFSPVDSTITLF